MSVQVTVHPIGSNILLTDVDAAKKDEWNRRRKIRIQQVREQSKDVATRVRKSISAEKKNRQMAEEKIHDALLREWQLKKIESLERQYKKCLEEVETARQQALQEKEMEALMKERRERLAKLAEARGKKAMETVRKETLDHQLEKKKAEKAKHFKKTVEDLRSSLVSTLPHPKKVSSPKKNFGKAASRRPLSNKENLGVINSARVPDVSEKTARETRQPSPVKKKRVISGQRDADVGSISSRKTWPPTTTIPLKRTAKGTPPKKPRRVIHSFDRECTNEGQVPAANFNLAQNKRQQVSSAAQTLKESVRRVLPDVNMNDDFGHLVENLSSLAEQEKFLRNQLLSQVQQCMHPGGEPSKVAERPTEVPKSFIHSVSQIMDQTLIDDTQPDRGANQKRVSGSAATKKSSSARRTTDRDSLRKSGSAEKKRLKPEDVFCDACRKYLEHSCAEHSTTVTESTSNSSSLTYMSLSKSTIESNSSSTTVEGVKVIVAVHGQKNLVKSVKIGKPIHLKKKKRTRKSEKPKSVKQPRVESRSGSVTSYLSPPDRVPAENSEMVRRILQEFAKSGKSVDLEQYMKRFFAKSRDIRTPDSSDARDSDKQLSPLLQTDPSMKRDSASDGTFSEDDGPSGKKVDKICQTLTICDKTVQTSRSLHESPRKESGDRKSPEKRADLNNVETEKLIDYYCNVADKYTDCINHIIGVLNRSANATNESLNSSSTSHRSPPYAFHDSIHLSKSMKQLALATKQRSKPSSPVKTSPPKDATIQGSPKRDKQSLDKAFVTQQQRKFLSSSFFDEDGNLINQAAVQQMLESTGSSVDRERPFGNFTLDISSLTSEEENGEGVINLMHSSLDSNEKSLFRKVQPPSAPVQQPKFSNNRVIAVPQDLSTIIEVDTPSTTHRTGGSLLHDASARKRTQKTDLVARQIIEKNQAILQTRIESLQHQIEILNQSQKSRSADTSQELKLSPGESKKSDKATTTQQRKSDGDSPNGHNTSTESELPDIVEELMKRGLISSPFPWMKDLKEKFSKDESTQSRKRTTSPESDSTQLINEELENILRNDLSPADLEDVFKNLGSSWAVSTWKKIAETSRFNSLSSSDSSPGAAKKPELSDSRSHAKNTPPKHSTPIKHKKRHRSSQVSTSPSQSNDISPEVVFPQDLNCGISSVNNSASDVYDLTPPDVALHRPQLFRKDNSDNSKHSNSK